MKLCRELLDWAIGPVWCASAGAEMRAICRRGRPGWHCWEVLHGGVDSRVGATQQKPPTVGPGWGRHVNCLFQTGGSTRCEGTRPASDIRRLIGPVSCVDDRALPFVSSDWGGKGNARRRTDDCIRRVRQRNGVRGVRLEGRRALLLAGLGW